MENQDQQPETTNGENGLDKEATLNYIDKMFGTMTHIWGMKTRVAVATIILSFLLLVISVGWVSAKSDFSLGGLGLEVSFSVLLTGSMVFLAALVVSFYFLHVRSTLMRWEIIKLYEAIGYSTENMDDFVLGPFESMDPIVTLAAPSMSKNQPNHRLLRAYNMGVGLTVLFLLIMALPVAAETAALIKLASTVGWQRFWIWIPFALFVLITLMVSIAFWIDNRV